MPHESIAPDDDSTLHRRTGSAATLEIHRVAPDRLHASLFGDVDFVITPTLGTQLIAHLDDAVRLLVIDLRRVTLLSAAAVGLLYEVAALAGACDTAVRLIANTHAVLHPLALTGADQRLAVYPSLHDAWSA